MSCNCFARENEGCMFCKCATPLSVTFFTYICQSPVLFDQVLLALPHLDGCQISL